MLLDQGDVLGLFDDHLAFRADLGTGIAAGVALGVLIALVTAGCSLLPKATNDETAGWSAEKIYTTAHEAMQDGNYTRAVKPFDSLEAQHLPELQALFATEDVGIKLELSEVNLVDREVVRFLGKCEAGGVRLDHCPAYIREWILREQCDE